MNNEFEKFLPKPSLRLVAWTAVLGCVLTLIVFAYEKYAGNPLVYLLFSLISNALLLAGFRNKALFFDAFIGIFFWLGFWLKLTIRVAFYGGAFSEATGGFSGSGGNFDHALIVASCGLSGFLMASFIREKYFYYNPQDSSDGLSGLAQFYQNHRRLILWLFVIFYLTIAGTNAYYGIYQRGTITRTILPLGLNGVYTWLLLFGLSSFTALLLKFEFDRTKKAPLKILLFGLIENFVSNSSMLSRGMVMNSSSLLLGAYKSFGFSSLFQKFKFYLISFTVFLILFGASVFVVNFLRYSIFFDPPSIQEQSSQEQSSTSPSSRAAQEHQQLAARIATTKNMTSGLFIDRWVGMEGAMAVSSSSELGWNLWREAWQERYNEHETSFYDLRLIESPYAKTDKDKHHFISLPGIIAFFYYPGSLVFLFGSMLLLGWLAAGIEIASYKLSGGNLILCALLGQVVAFRYHSFGYVPTQSYLLFGTIALNLIIIFAADKVALKWYKFRAV